MILLEAFITICILTIVSAQNSGLLCESFDVSGSSDSSFNGKYKLSTLTSSSAPDYDVYQKNSGNKLIYWKNRIGWVIGPLNGLTSGEENYRGILPVSSRSTARWAGRGNFAGTTVTVRNSSRVCSDVFSTDDEEYLDDITTLSPGTNGCRGLLKIVHSMAGDSSSDLKTSTFPPFNYKKTRSVFRGRDIVNAEVSGTCSWYFYSRKRFGGRSVSAPAGFNSHLPFSPFSISQR